MGPRGCKGQGGPPSGALGRWAPGLEGAGRTPVWSLGAGAPGAGRGGRTPRALQGAQPAATLMSDSGPQSWEGTHFQGLKPLSPWCFAMEVGENEHREPVGEKVIVNSSGHVVERGQRTSPFPGQDREHLSRDAGCDEVKGAGQGCCLRCPLSSGSGRR